MAARTARDAGMGMLTVVLFGLVTCLLYGVGGGLRGDIGILLNPLAEHCHLVYEDVSFCIAVMQLMFGATQPAFGILASRRSNRFVLVLGVGLFAAGLVGMMLADGFLPLLLSLGVLFGAGAGAVSFGLILSSAIYYVGPERAMIVSGMLNAAAGLGSFVLAPVLQALLQTGGVAGALSAMLVPVLLLVPIAVLVTRHDPRPEPRPAAAKPAAPAASERTPVGPAAPATAERTPAGPTSAGQAAPAAAELAEPATAEFATPAAGERTPAEPAAREPLPFREAFRNRTYLLLVAGFSTCGFHMVIIESHLFSQYVSYGIDPTAASWVFSLYGIATILGALLSGWLSLRVRKGKLLGFYYGFRAVWVLAYLFLAPKNVATAVLFSIGLGMTGDATVSPTSGLVNANFRVGQVATLIGFLFLVHQIGAFLAAWLGGVLLGITGGYDAIWLMDVALCIFACAMSLLIREK